MHRDIHANVGQAACANPAARGPRRAHRPVPAPVRAAGTVLTGAELIGLQEAGVTGCWVPTPPGQGLGRPSLLVYISHLVKTAHLRWRCPCSAPHLPPPHKASSELRLPDSREALTH